VPGCPLYCKANKGYPGFNRADDMKIQSVQRALDIISLFSKSRPHYKLTGIARSLNLSVSTAHGLVSTLEQNGFLRQDPRTREYRLGAKIYEQGCHFAAGLNINLHAARPAQDLARRNNLTARVGIWDSNSVIITLFAFPQGTANSAHNFGPRLLPYCTAIGKAILAFMDRKACLSYLEGETLVRHTKYTLTTIEDILADLEKTHERGYAVNRAEWSLGRSGIAAPIRGPGDEIEGAVSLPGNTDDILGENIRRLANDLLHTASEISESLGFLPA